MNRALLGSAAAFVGLGVAAVALNADMLIGPRGTPLMVEAPSIVLQPANFDATCAPTLLFSDRAPDDVPDGSRIVGFTLRSGGVVVSMDDGAAASGAPMILVFDSADNLIGVGTPAELLPLLPEIAAPCAAAPDAERLLAPI